MVYGEYQGDLEEDQRNPRKRGSMRRCIDRKYTPDKDVT